MQVMKAAKDIDITPARVEDAPAMLDIIREVFEAYDMIYDPENDYPDLVDFERSYPPDQQELFVIKFGGELVGFGAVKEDAQGVPYLSRIYIAPEHQGLGLGERLVRFLTDKALSQYDRVYLWTDTRFTKAHNLYKKLGFEPDGRCEPLGDINESFEYYYEKKRPD